MPTGTAKRLFFAVVLILVCIGLFTTAFVEYGASLEVDVKSDYSHIRIRKRGQTRTMLFVRDSGKEVVESRINLEAPHELVLSYSQTMFASYLLHPEPRRVLIVGLGAGSMIHFLKYHQPELQIDAIEIDPVVVRLSAEYFGTRPDKNVEIMTADGFDFLRNTERRYDVIFMDAFLKPSGPDQSGTPQRLRTLEFFAAIKSKLTEKGLVVFNLTIQSDTKKDITTIRTAFPQTAVFRSASKNMIAVGSIRPLPDSETLRTRAGELDRQFRTNFSFQDVLKSRRN